MTSLFLRSVIIGAILTTFVGCGQNSDVPNSRLKITPADRNAKNIALIIGSPNDLTGVAKDVSEIAKMIRESNLGYEVKVVSPASASQVMNAADEIGKSLTPNSTVFFYYSGHGAESGVLIGQGYQTFRLSSVAKRMGASAPGGKFKRFIAVLDSCFSGQNVNGSESMFMTSQTKSEQDSVSSFVGMAAADMKPKSMANVPFEQALILAAAQRNEESLDFGSSIGGAFTASWRKILKKGFQSGQQFTVGQLLEETKAETRRETDGSHTPVWKAMPESLLSESLSNISSPQDLNTLYVALGDVSIGASLVFVSLPTSITAASVELCRGDKVICSSGANPKLASFVDASDIKIPDRHVFRSEKALEFTSGDVVTAVLRDSNGRAMDAVTVKLTAR